MRTKALVMVAVTLFLATSAWASSETVLYNFNSFTGDGYYPYSGLVADAKGNLYGTTQSGANGYGTVFELKLSGGTYTEVQLHLFNLGVSDGQYPEYSSLVLDKAGNLYGTTANGGAANEGTVFELKHSGGNWTESLLHSFTGAPKDGYFPQAGLSLDSAGNLYGTTEYGGKYSAGTVFQLKPSSNGKWSYKSIHSFVSGTGSGYYPVGGIVAGKNGYYYGTTYNGGGTFNSGTVYRLFLARGKWVGETVYVFTGGAAGTYPEGSLAMDTAGNFFGTTYQGGNSNFGTVYELKAGKNNKFTHSVLWNFLGPSTDGQNPLYSGVALDTKNNIYGTTYYGGTTSTGTVYRLKLTNGRYKESVLHVFGGTGDGAYPRAGVIIVKGKVLGTTYAGGTHGGGNVFSVKP